MLRRLHDEQPESFAFTPANLVWAKGQMTKYPEGRQRSAVIPLLWRAQEQEGWLSRPAIETVADMLGMDYIRALEVATFYFMFQLKPVGSVAHIQVCGTTTCMICGGEALVDVCREVIAPTPFTLSPDGKFSWEEVECLGACTNAPMVQIGKDYYEDLNANIFRDLLADFARGDVPVPGPQNGRYAAEPLEGLTSLKDFENGRAKYNASADLAVTKNDTIARITGDEKPASPGSEKRPSAKAKVVAKATSEAQKPGALEAPRGGKADDLTKLGGVGAALQKQLNGLGVWHFDQIAAWSAENVAWMDANLKRFKGRVSQENWVETAKQLTVAEGG